MNNRIEVPKGRLLSEEYTKRKVQEAIALLKFRYPNCEIEIEEVEEENGKGKIIITAVERQNESNVAKSDERDGGDER